MKYVIGDTEVSKDAPLTVETTDGRVHHIGTLEGILSLLRHYSVQPSPEEDQGLRDRAESAEATVEALKAALKESQGRCESLVREHAKYREGVVAGDRMVSDRRAALEKEIEGLRLELGRTKILLKNKEEELSASEAQVRSLQVQCEKAAATINDLQHKLAKAQADIEWSPCEPCDPPKGMAPPSTATLEDRVEEMEKALAMFMIDVRRAVPWLGAVRQ